MCQPHLSSEAIGLLQKAARHGELVIALTSPVRHNRPIMELIVAGLLSPVDVKRHDGEAEHIVYAVGQMVADQRVIMRG